MLNKEDAQKVLDYVTTLELLVKGPLPSVPGEALQSLIKEAL